MFLLAFIAACPGPGVVTGGAAADGSGVAASGAAPAKWRAPADALVNGGDADFDGNGVVDATTTRDGDSRKTVYFGAPGKARLTIVTRGSAVDVQGDFNEDGTADFHHTGATVGETRTQKSTWDTDFDGVVDETETMTFIGALGRGGAVRLVARHERRVHDPATGDAKVVVSERDDLAIDGSGDQHLLDEFPKSGTLVPVDETHTKMQVYDESTTGGCDKDQQRQIREAMENFEAHQMECIRSSNTTAAAALRFATRERNIEIACAPAPKGWAASDVGPMLGEDETRSSYRLNLVAKTFDQKVLEETLLHELMHVAGYAHIDDAARDAATDRVNSCAIYCTKCTWNGKPSERAATDCARCSEPGKKAACGVAKFTKATGPCHVPRLAACVGQTSVADCQDCVYGVERYCDLTTAPRGPVPVCCLECPGGFEMNLKCPKDVPSYPGFRVNTCDEKPPACR